MSLLFMDGFDHYLIGDIGKKWSSVGSSSPQLVTGRRGGKALNLSYNTNVSKNLTANHSVLVVGMAVKTSEISTGNIFEVSDGNNHQLVFHTNSVGGITVVRVTSLGGFTIGVTLGSSAGNLFIANTFFYLEAKVVIHPTAGSVIVRVNGIEVISLVDVNTRNTTNSYVNQLHLGPGTLNVDVTVDDLYVCTTSGSTNNDFLGDVRIDALIANGDGTFSQFTPSTGTSHFAVVDEATPNTTDYVSSNTSGHKDTFTFPDLPVVTGSVYAVQTVSACYKDDAGNVSIQTLALSGGTEAVSASFPLVVTPQYVMGIFETNPNGSIAWTQATVNAAEFGVKIP